jgi:hypothetical protein
MVEACECIKSWISVPKGKSRPLLAGVFREAEDIDAAVRILQEDIEMSKGAESDGEPRELVVLVGRQCQTFLGYLEIRCISMPSLSKIWTATGYCFV